ncbi:MAG: hypothetical protein MJY79_07900 [Bacteroidaceae bacterium]|nr:hypothetical protein [Bacteroidaceae bacterium]
MKTRTLIMTLAACLLASCAKVPAEFQEPGNAIQIMPDYKDVTVPSNIAPLNFYIMSDAARYVTQFKAGSQSYTRRGRTVAIPLRRWRSMLSDGPISVQVFAKSPEDGKWVGYRSFSITPSSEIDRYVSYRQIPPSYQQYEDIRLRQRDMSSFHDRAFYSNAMVHRPADGQGQCVNCHSFKNYGTDDMQFHTRQYKGGTIIYHDGKLRMVNIKNPATSSFGVYPAWHPTHDLIAYSTNSTMQAFHTVNDNHIEVFDSESDLILYDLKANRVSIVSNDPDQLECFPTWSPDGKMLYYVSAKCPKVPEGADRTEYLASVYEQVRYDIFRKSFDPETKTWGPAEKVFDASSQNRSATLPRISPDGKRLMFTLGEWGVFHIWHKDADLYMMDLETMQARAIAEINSQDTESYHSWSSNGEWVIFGSRREDGGFTRLFITHANQDGTFSKPFTLPQRDPWSNTHMLTSYSVPELTGAPVRLSARKLTRFVRHADVESVTF